MIRKNIRVSTFQVTPLTTFPLVQWENLLKRFFCNRYLVNELKYYKRKLHLIKVEKQTINFYYQINIIADMIKWLDYKTQKIIILYMNFKIVNVQTDLVNRIWLQRESKFSKMLSQVGIYYYNKYNKYNLSFGERRATRQRRITEQKAPIAIHRPATRKSRDLDTFYHWIASRMTTKKARNRMVYENILLSYFILF